MHIFLCHGFNFVVHELNLFLQSCIICTFSHWNGENKKEAEEKKPRTCVGHWSNWFNESWKILYDPPVWVKTRAGLSVFQKIVELMQVWIGLVAYLIHCLARTGQVFDFRFNRPVQASFNNTVHKSFANDYSYFPLLTFWIYRKGQKWKVKYWQCYCVTIQHHCSMFLGCNGQKNKTRALPSLIFSIQIQTNYPNS